MKNDFYKETIVKCLDNILHLEKNLQNRFRSDETNKYWPLVLKGISEYVLRRLIMRIIEV